MEDFDPDMDAISARRKKIALTISFDPDDETCTPQVDVMPPSSGDDDTTMAPDDGAAAAAPHGDEDQDKALIMQMMQEHDAKQADANQKDYANQDSKISDSIMAGDSPERVMSDMSGRQPRSISERARFDLAKKKMGAPK